MSNGNHEPEFRWSHCNECVRDTKHDIVHQADRRRTYHYDQCSVDAGSVWRTLQCRGCDEVTLERIDWCSEDDPMDGPRPSVFYPPRVSRRKPDWVDRLTVPIEYEELLDEIYVALHADSRRLAVMGARALIDVAITRNVGDQGNFPRGLASLFENGLISGRSRSIIEAVLEVGHASSHRGHLPSSEDVNLVIDAVENLIHTELLAEPAAALKSMTPQRERVNNRNRTE